MITMLQKYLTLNTQQPDPNYDDACDFLQAQAERDGFITQKVQLPSQKPVLIITYYGKNLSLPSVVLNHHMDVVPKSPNDTFKDGTLINNVLYGRGTQDMKGVGIVHYAALKKLKDSGIPLERTIHLLAVPDEEIGGFTGTGQFITTPQFKNLAIGFVVDEGLPSGNNNEIFIKTAERKPLQIQVSCKGKSAHGSHLLADNPIHELLSFLHQVIKLHKKQQQKASLTQPGQLLSCNITSLTAGEIKNNTVTLNMIPASATATIDIRIPAFNKKSEIKKLLNDMLADHPKISYTIKAAVDDYQANSHEQTQLYASLKKAIEKSGHTVKPYYFEATTDLRFYHQLGIQGIGCTPFTCQENLHGTDESITTTDLMRGTTIMYNFLQLLCTAKEL